MISMTDPICFTVLLGLSILETASRQHPLANDPPNGTPSAQNLWLGIVRLHPEFVLTLRATRLTSAAARIYERAAVGGVTVLLKPQPLNG